MKNNPLESFLIHLLTMLALIFFGPSMAQAQEMLVDQNAKLKQAFVLLQAEMTNQEVFFYKYAIPAEMVVSAYGGRALVATFDKKVVEGAWDNNWSIVLRFPSLKAATDWYYSYKYQALIPYRHAATAFGNMVMFEGTPESVIVWRVTQYDGVIPTLRFPETLDQTPEHVVTISPSWSASEEKFVVSASFEKVSYKGANLSLEMKIPKAYVDNQNLIIRILLKDSAGHRASLGTVLAGSVIADEWCKLEFGGNATDFRSIPYVRDRTIDLTKINAVEIAFDANRKPVQVSGDIQIRNLRISK